MRKLLEKIQAWRGHPNENSNDIFERIATDFRQDTGFLRPGKSSPYNDDEERKEAWDKWTIAKTNEIDNEIVEALAKDDEPDKLIEFMKKFGYVKGDIIDFVIKYIKVNIPNDPRATGAPGWDKNHKDVTIASCNRCSVVGTCIFTNDPGHPDFVSHMAYWCYKCYMVAKV